MRTIRLFIACLLITAMASCCCGGSTSSTQNNNKIVKVEIHGASMDMINDKVIIQYTPVSVNGEQGHPDTDYFYNNYVRNSAYEYSYIQDGEYLYMNKEAKAKIVFSE